jgi:methylated-DNA-[protein]-cysteine S-methyltransferase
MTTCPHVFTLFETSIGPCGIAWNDRGIVAVQLPERSDARTVARLADRVPGAKRVAAPSDVQNAIDQIVAHLGGAPGDLGAIVLDTSGLAPFHARVYEALRRVPPGTTVTYGELAARVGAPHAARAVGQAMRRNPFPIVVPCHRVVASGGRPGGFSAFGGVVTKAKLLALEGKKLDGSEANGTGLPFDAGEALAHLSSRDRKLARIIESIGPLRLRTDPRASSFEALAEAIVYQQLTGRAAATIYGRVQALFPRKRASAKALLALSDAHLRGCGLSGSKLRALRDLAEKTLDGTVPKLDVLHTLEDDAIVDRLVKVRGIGRWTVQMLLIFRLGRPDVLPIDDYGVRKGFAAAFRKRELPTPKELAEYGERWRPYRTVASWYMWRVADRAKT